MKTSKKQISVLLAVMMILCSITAISFSVSAAETTGGKVTVKSNLCDSKTYNYTANDKQIEVKYFLQSDNMILNMQGGLHYDSSVLKLASSNTAKTSVPGFTSGSYYVNFNLTNKALFNATSLNLFDFTSKGVFFTAVFDIVGSGNTEVNLDVDVITATTANSYDDLDDASDIDLVYYGDIATSKFAFSAEGNVIPDDTENVSVFGDINLTLVKNAGSNVYTGTTDLQAGTYTFRINDHGTTKCNGSAFTDTIYNVEYNPNWRSATTLNVSGGRYTFSFNADNNKLLVQFKPFSEIVELFGDINVALVKNSAGIFNGIARLEQGSYQFRINDQGTVKCNGSTFDSDSIYKVTYREDWRNASTLIAKGGVYAVKYDPATSQLTIMASPGGAGDVRIFGDIELDLLKDKGTLYSAVTTLEAGTYTFRVDDRGTIKCNGSTFNNTIYDIQYSADWKSETTFNVPGGRYLFRYDSATERLTAFDLPAVETVSVFGDFDLKLTKGTGNIYTGTIALEAGSYSFRIDEFGATMCAGHKINDKASNLEFSSEWRAAATLNATGGNYTFSYNADTNKLTVTYAE
mgnify:FL=1